jgi:hypothetical protein
MLILGTLKMKLIDYFIIDSLYYDSPVKLGINWTRCQQGPGHFFPTEDREYWSYLLIEVFLFSKVLQLDIRLQKMPYKNKEEYKTWRRNEKENKSV